MGNIQEVSQEERQLNLDPVGRTHWITGDEWHRFLEGDR